MHNNNTTTTTTTTTTTATQLATAPEIPSSMNYYDPRSYNNYNPNFTHQQPSTTNNTPNNTNTATTPPSGTVTAPNTSAPNYINANYTTAASNTYQYHPNHTTALINHSLPPLSHLLPTNNNSKSDQAQPNNRKNSAIDTVYSQPQGYYYIPLQQQQQHGHLQTPPSSVPSQSDLSFHPPLPTNMYATRHGQIYHLPSPPTSVTDGVLITDPNQFHFPHPYPPYVQIPPSSNQKVFSFVPLPGLNQKKRPRRKFHEVERLYQCNYQDCTKAYGTLNHLNAHVSMQRHGPKRQPSEFKELRKIWRKQKRENKQRQMKQQQEEDQDQKNNSMNEMLATTTTAQEYPIYHPTPWNTNTNRYEFMPPPY